MAVRVEVGSGAPALRGAVRRVEPSGFTKVSALGVEEQRVYVIADFTDPAAKRPTLGDSYRVEARIVTWESPSSLQAPAGALFRRGGGWRTFVSEGGRAVLRTVQPGRSNGVQTEITGGLREGQYVADENWFDIALQGGTYVGNLHEASDLADKIARTDGGIPRVFDVAARGESLATAFRRIAFKSWARGGELI